MTSYNNPYHTKQPGQSTVYHPNYECPDPFSYIPPSSMMFGPFLAFHTPAPCEKITSTQLPCTRYWAPLASPSKLHNSLHRKLPTKTTLLNSFPCLHPPHLAQVIADTVVHHILFLLVDTKDTSTEHIPHCLLLTTNTSRPVPSDKTWLSSLHSNPDTLLMLSKLAANPLYVWPEKEIQQISAVYRSYL